MTEPQIDVATTLFVLPADAKFLRVTELSPRLQARIGPVEEGHSVITRPGFRTTTRLVPPALATLLREFNQPSRVTDAVLRFARAHEQDPMAVLELAFDALATLVEARILVPHDSPDASALAPSFAAGQEFAGFEIEALVRSLEDSELYRARTVGGESVALKITRDDRASVVATFAHEAAVLEQLGGGDTPALIAHGTSAGRAYVAMEWCEGVSIAVAAQQARAARDRTRLQQLVGRMLKTYGRLHARGILHGDIHQGNCLITDDGRVVVVDFGNARMADDAVPASQGSTIANFELGRTGIPQFHDPQMAASLLAGQLPPPVTRLSEQYAIAVLAYLLVTGVHPLDAPAVHEDLLRHIVERPPLAFPARGVPAWPAVEHVLRRALAKEPGDRFPDVAAFAAAFTAAEAFPLCGVRRASVAEQAFDAAVDRVRNLAPDGVSLDLVWFGLRASLVLEDAELLAATELLARRLGPDWASQAVVAHVARARSDRRLEGAGIDAFIADASGSSGEVLTAAVLAATGILEGGAFRLPDTARLAGWCAQQIEHLLGHSQTPDNPSQGDGSAIDCQRLTAVLSVVHAGAVAMPAELPRSLESLVESQGGDAWLWARAYDVIGDERYKQRASSVGLPATPLMRAFALLRLHQLTGEMEWVARAEQVLADSIEQLTSLETALLVAELRSPETALLPPSASAPLR